VGPSDRRLVYAAVGLRSLATKVVGLLLSYHLAAGGFGTPDVGKIVAAGLAGVALSTLVVARAGDRVPRRRALIGLSLATGIGILATAVSTLPAVVLAAAFLGMLNGAGRDRGALVALDQAVLPATVPDGERTRAFALYGVFGNGGRIAADLLVWGLHAGGARLGASRPDLDRGGMLGAAAVVLGTAWLYRSLSASHDASGGAAPVPLTPTTRRRLWGISALFGLDALGGGFLATALWATFFRLRFGLDEGTFALLDLGGGVLNAISQVVAAWLARRIGLVNTMVFTHIPSSLFLATVAIAPSWPVAAAFYLLREGFVEMDVPTRTSYVMAIVRPHERTTVSAVTNLVRIAGWAVAAYGAGDLMEASSLGTPLLVAAAMKIAYDLLLWFSFRRLRPPEETRS
jgi:predicted MFS family arabinose efflux permease